MAEPEILKRIETLSGKLQALGKKALKAEQKERAVYAGNYLDALGMMMARGENIFCVEPWHPLEDNLPLSYAGEMLLRVRDYNGEPMPPYPAIMTLYHNGFTEEFDTMLCLCALDQFRAGEEKQVSINISCRALQNAAFVKAILSKIEGMKLGPERKIILEIHESNAVVEIPRTTSHMFKKLGVEFAIDDVGLSMNDVFRLSAFENIADYIKLDRQTVNGHPDDPRALVQILALAHSFLPKAHMVAEGIQSAKHASEIIGMHPNVRYVQGMKLPDRETFQKEWAVARPRGGGNKYRERLSE